MNLKIFSLMIWLMLPWVVMAQSDYSPTATITRLPPDIQHAIFQKLQSDLANVPLSGKSKRLLTQLYQARYDQFMTDVASGMVMEFPELDLICQKVLEELREKNPGIPLPSQVFVTRDPSPNARCLGEGTLLIHLGLIRRMQNEDQLAFAISHELAHYYLDHVNQGLINYSIKATDPNTERELSRLIRNAENPFETMLSYLQGERYLTHRHSRNKEREADSLGLQFLLNTSYAPEGAIGCVTVLESVDKPKYEFPIDYERMLRGVDHPSDSSWRVYHPSTNYVYGQNAFTVDWELDSLATHPDCQERLRNLRRQLTHRSIDESKIQMVSPFFRDLEKKLDMEWLLSFFHAEAYGRTLYLAFQLTEIYPDEPHLHAIIGQSIYLIYQHKKSHTLSNKLEFPNPLREESYNQFLTFARKHRLQDWADFGLQYLLAQPATMRENESFMYTLLLCASIQRDKNIFDSLRQSYYDKFAGGEYSQDVEALNASFDH